jgi:hypothetical protein
MANLNRQEIAVHQLVAARECLYSVLAPRESHQRARMARTAEHAHFSVLGDAVHKLMSDKTIEVVAQTLSDDLSDLPEPEREIVLHQAAAIAQKKKAALEAGDNVLVEKLQQWVDTETRWKIFSQPDRVETLIDDEGEYVQVRDWKLDVRVRWRHKASARIFGLIEYMRSKGQKRVKVCVESLVGGASEWCEWITSPHDAINMLRDIQATLRRIEEAMKSDRPVKRTTGRHCYGCKIKNACREGGKWLAKDQEQRPRPPAKPVLATA